MIGVGLLTFATLAVTAAIIKTEKIHDIPGRELGEGGGGVPGPQGGVGRHRHPAVLLDPVQVQPSVPSVSGVLKFERN